MSTALSGLASERMLAMADAEPGSVITVSSVKVLGVETFTFTKLENRDWQDIEGGKPWETPQLAAILHSIGGQQTLETHASNSQP